MVDSAVKSLGTEVEKLRQKLIGVTLPPELKIKVEEDVDRLGRVAVNPAAYTQ